jgi:GxxExxY protein
MGPRMHANTREWEILDGLVERVVGAVYEVANVLGAGFLEKVYERALMKELGLRGLKVRSQVAFSVGYKGQCVGEYLADLLVERLIVELKCVDRFANEHLAQFVNYLKASGVKLALLVNFQRPRVDRGGLFSTLRFAFIRGQFIISIRRTRVLCSPESGCRRDIVGVGRVLLLASNRSGSFVEA